VEFFPDGSAESTMWEWQSGRSLQTVEGTGGGTTTSPPTTEGEETTTTAEGEETVEEEAVGGAEVAE
ncbi:MAG: hypothetical protein M3M87_00815, partial [Thermoproteota archaeon]|nr:hypothetical protein [Thermoproteota archaeon]